MAKKIQTFGNVSYINLLEAIEKIEVINPE